MLSEPLIVVERLVRTFDDLAIRYLVGGSFASSLYGIPRDTPRWIANTSRSGPVGLTSSSSLPAQTGNNRFQGTDASSAILRCHERGTSGRLKSD